MSRYLIVFLPLIMMLETGTALSLKHYKHEAHSIMKRLAEVNEDFEGHDVAQVYGMGGRRLVKRDLRSAGNAFKAEDLRSLQLHLSSGSKVNLALLPAGIVGPDTVVSHHTRRGRTEKKWDGGNCFSHGHLEDSSGKGLAVISHCNGIFGFANTPAYDYLVYPLNNKRFKRDAEADSGVHLMWRRSETGTSENVTDSPIDLQIPIDDEVALPPEDDIPIAVNESTVDSPTSKNVVIEMAVFEDEKSWRRLHKAYPGREDDFTLTMIAGVQALFGNTEIVDYNIQIKIKLLEYWRENPEGYVFKQSIANNFRSFCKYIKKNKYKYDTHALHTGVMGRGGVVGLAYVGGACSKNSRCFVKKSFGLRSFSLFAHELGHSLGMNHQSRGNCPKDEPYVGGFMGGGRIYNFSPCMKRHLSKFLKSRRSRCLYTESAETKTSEDASHLPRLFPGQTKSPDQLCELLAGRGYNYVPMAKKLGHSTCRWMVCYNEDETSDEFGRAKRMFAPAGFPCGEDFFCVRQRDCKQWNVTKTVFAYDDLRNMAVIPEWTEWSTEFSACSRSCGTGVRTRRRECRFTGYNFAPYCPGLAVKPELCNTEPCPGDPKDIIQLRQVRGDEVCERFKEKNVTLNLRSAKEYLPTARSLKKIDITPPANILKVHSKSCLMKCERVPIGKRGNLDAFRPDGSPCYGSERLTSELSFLNIELRCVRGSCLEFTDCSDASQSKDECGVCGGDGSSCVSLSFNSTYDVPLGEYSLLTMIPSGSTNIHVYMDRKVTNGIVLEMWSDDDQSIIGRTGLYSGKVYWGSSALKYAGTEWSYRRNTAVLQALGPTREHVKIKAYRSRTGNPIKMITIKYSKNQEA